MFQGLDKLLVDEMGFVVPGGLRLDLIEESRPLLDRIIKLAEGICELEPGRVCFESLDETWILWLAFSQGRQLDRVVNDKSWLNKRRLDLHAE